MFRKTFQPKSSCLDYRLTVYLDSFIAACVKKCQFFFIPPLFTTLRLGFQFSVMTLWRRYSTCVSFYLSQRRRPLEGARRNSVRGIPDSPLMPRRHSTCHRPRPSAIFFITNVTWLLDKRKDTIERKSIHTFSCVQRKVHRSMMSGFRETPC